MNAPRDLVSCQWARHRWLVISDEGARSFATRQAAQHERRAIERHPAMSDRRQFGPYSLGGATGRAQVLDLGHPDRKRMEAGKPAYDVWEALVREGLAEWADYPT